MLSSSAERRNGEIVVALIDARMQSRIRTETKANVILHPANSQMSPMRFSPDQVSIQGVPCRSDASLPLAASVNSSRLQMLGNSYLDSLVSCRGDNCLAIRRDRPCG